MTDFIRSYGEEFSNEKKELNDVEIIEKAKYNINMDVGCMIEGAWIESLENGGIESENVYSRQLLIDDFVCYYHKPKLQT